MKIKRPLFRGYAGIKAYKQLYEKVKRAIETSEFVDGYQCLVADSSSAIGGIYRTINYYKLFDIDKSLPWPIFESKKEVDKGKIRTKRKSEIFVTLGDKISVDIYKYNSGYWLEVRAEPVFSTALSSHEVKNVEFILNKLADLPTSREINQNMQLMKLRQLEDRINEVLN